MFPTTFDTETDLSAVNSILGSIGQAPVTKLDFKNPEVALVSRILQETNNQVQSEGWVFNTERYYPLTPDSSEEIKIPENILQMDLSDNEPPWMEVIKRDGKLYDKLNHTYKFKNKLHFDIVWKFAFEDLPHPFKEYITSTAALRVATQLVVDADLYKLLSATVSQTRASVMEYECSQGDYNYLGYPAGTRGNNYRPYQALQR